jgi:hypothetical protein
MDLVSSRAEALRAAVLAAAAAIAVVFLAPPGGDSAAHLYRTDLIREGVHVWDNLWYGGHYPLASYSLLYYVPASVVGNVPLVVLAVVVSAVLFASLVVHEWGADARWPARAFGVLAAAPLFTGTYSYALGVTASLAALRLLQTGRPWLAVGGAGLALAFSPLAFVFLCMTLVAIAAARGRVDRRTVALAAALAGLAVLQLVAISVFPSEGRYPFSLRSLLTVLPVSALAAALAYRSPRARVLGVLFVLWGLANLAAFFVPSAFGDNLARLRSVAFPLVLLIAVLVRFRPRVLAVAALAAALAYNLWPDVRALPKRAEDARTAQAAFWQPAVAFLEENGEPGYRVEVVPTFGHWEAYWIPRAGFPLARGWYRQLDIVQNPELYRASLSPEDYRSWLRRMSVRYVLLPEARLGPLGAEREAELLRSGRAGLELTLRTRDWSIYEFSDAVSMLTGPGLARVDAVGHDRISARVSAPGSYRLAVRYTPYWTAATGNVCVAEGPDGMTRVRVRSPGRFELVVKTPAEVVRRAPGAGAAC